MADEAEKYKLVLGAFVEGSAGQSLHGAPQGPGLQLGVGEAEKLLGVLALSPQETLGWVWDQPGWAVQGCLGAQPRI